MFYGLGGLIHLALCIYGGYSVLTSSVDTPRKLAWIILIVWIPIIGFLIWAFFGPRGKKLF